MFACVRVFFLLLLMFPTTMSVGLVHFFFAFALRNVLLRQMTLKVQSVTVIIKYIIRNTVATTRKRHHESKIRPNRSSSPALGITVAFARKLINL